MKRVLLFSCVVCLLFGVGTSFAAESLNMSDNLGYLYTNSMDLPNNSSITINVYMPIHVYVENGDGFHILQIGNGNLTAEIINRTDKNMIDRSADGTIIVHQGPLAEIGLTSNTSLPVRDETDIASLISNSIHSSP